MSLWREGGVCVRLAVPGLADQRPSVGLGDRVRFRETLCPPSPPRLLRPVELVGVVVRTDATEVTVATPPAFVTPCIVCRDIGAVAASGR